MNTGLHFQFNLEDANRLLVALISFEVSLAAIFALDVISLIPSVFHKPFDLDGEGTIPAWFSSMQLFVIGILFLFSRHWPQTHQIVKPGFLRVIGIGFVFLSMDEAASIHERITALLKHIEWVPRFEGGHGIWIPVYLSIAVVLLGIGRRTIISMLNTYPRQMLIMFFGVVLFIIGGIGMEIISYWYLRGTGLTLLYKAEVAIEEFLEMSGASIVLYGAILCALREPAVPGSGIPASPGQGARQPL
ncbi:MAG: hypothetical protein ACE5FQ_10595 [Thiogranum sp.]